MSAFRISKPVVVIAKGVSSQFVPSSDDYLIAACSEAVRLCDQCIFLAVNDMRALKSLTDEDLNKTEFLLLPRYLHTDASANPGLCHWKIATAEMILPEVILYKLHTDPDPAFSDGLPSFGRCRSISDSLVAFLLYSGVREIITCGIETTGRTSYHPMFKRKAHKNKEWRRSIWQHTKARITKAGATVRRFDLEKT